MIYTNCDTKSLTELMKKYNANTKEDILAVNKMMSNNLFGNLLSKFTEPILKILLKDRTTQKSVCWATEEYETYGPEYYANKEITLLSLSGLPSFILRPIIQPRMLKPEKSKVQRTRKKAEVFTPSWICNLQNNIVDEDWFGRKNVFNETLNTSWETISSLIAFPKDQHKSWKKYVDSRRLEITCGEAPYLTSRYDMVTGKNIDVSERIGMLDRKLRIVNENTENETDWFQWAKRAYQSTYGYEYQGDSVLIARLNLLLTFVENMKFRWNREAISQELEEIARIISWNIWQMDGLSDTVPYGVQEKSFSQLSFDELLSDNPEKKVNIQPQCWIMNWRAKRSVKFSSLKEMNMPFADKTDYKRRKANMKFDVIIGNPPYQEETNGELRNYAPPIYNLFLDEAYKISDIVEMIHPARFLFNAGSTPKSWNKKMLQDEHLKVAYYEADSNKVFPGLSTPIKGGIVITYRNSNQVYGALQTFTPYIELNSIAHKVRNAPEFKSLCDIVYSRTSYRFTNKMHEEHPEAISKLSNGHAYDMSSNIFQRLPEIFFNKDPDDGKEYIEILGRDTNRRKYKYIRRDYVNNVVNLFKYKVYIAQANGSGIFGEALSEPMIGAPSVGATETFISIGCFDTEREAIATSKYIKTKFARALLSILKVTQNGNKPVWEMVPLQDFTPNSDIDWTKSIHEIDLQLYKKYGLDEKEINFIETKVKEME